MSMPQNRVVGGSALILNVQRAYDRLRIEGCREAGIVRRCIQIFGFSPFMHIPMMKRRRERARSPNTALTVFGVFWFVARVVKRATS